MLAEVVREANKRHGRQAFGLIVVLTVWALIVQPNLNVAVQAHEQAAVLTANMRDTAAALRDTARWLAVANSHQAARTAGENQ